jgi:hypothetical protein
MHIGAWRYDLELTSTGIAFLTSWMSTWGFVTVDSRQASIQVGSSIGSRYQVDLDLDNE